MDESTDDMRLPHHREPKEFVSLDQLASMIFPLLLCSAMFSLNQLLLNDAIFMQS